VTSQPPSNQLTDVVLRTAVPADAEAAARCHLECWREAYRGLIPDSVLDSPTGLDQRIESWTTMITNGPLRLLAVADGEVAGFIHFGPGHDDDIDVDDELGAIYVRKAWWGTGLGQRLLAVSAPGVPDAYVWVLADNARAIAFYAKNGFVADGASKFLARLDATEIRMVRRS